MSSLSPKDRVSLCSFAFSDGRRCRTPHISSHPHFCFYHAQKEARACAADKLGKDLDYFFSGDYLSACDLSTTLGRLIPAVLRGDVKPKTAHTVAYLMQTLMQAIHISQDEYINAFDTNGWRAAIRTSVNGNRDYRFPPAPQPAPPQCSPPQAQPLQPAEPPTNCHSERSEESASSSAPPQAQQPASAPPANPIQPTPVAQPSRGEPSASDGPSSPARPQPQPHASPSVQTPINCHSERSEESASSSNSPLATSPSFTPSAAQGPLPSAQPNNTPPTTPPTPPTPNRDAPWLHFGDPGKIRPDSHLL